jgi:O-antigen ligase
MFVVWVVYKRSRLGYAAIALMVVAALLLPVRGMSLLKPLDPRISSHFSVLYRLEQYPFAMHILEKHPFTGIGLRSLSHSKFLEDYQQKNPKLTRFRAKVKEIQTFDNMFVTSVVELGSVFTLAYLALLTYVAVVFFRSYGVSETDERCRIYRVLPLIGLMVQSMTYDSLMFPSINWLFHAQVGILAAIPRGESHYRGNSIDVVS